MPSMSTDKCPSTYSIRICSYPLWTYPLMATPEIVGESIRCTTIEQFSRPSCSVW